MRTRTSNFAPYAYVGNVINVIRGIRNSPPILKLDSIKMQEFGVSEGNINRTKAALEFLNIIDDNEEITLQAKELYSSDEKEYRSILKELIQESYKSLFSGGELLFTEEFQISNAFIKYEPRKQNKKMIKLFQGLCKEANIIEGEPLISSRSGQYDSNKYISKYWAKELETVLQELPSPDRLSWTQKNKTVWLTSLSALLDIKITLIEEHPTKGGENPTTRIKSNTFS